MRADWEKLENLSTLAAVREAAEGLRREYLLDMLQWNDPNGSWTDARARAEDTEPATKDEAVQAVVEVVRDHAWVHNDPRRETDTLVSERNTPAVEALVMKAAGLQFEPPFESPRAVYEHGQWWVVAYDREEDREVTFSVHDEDPGVGDTGLGFEQLG